MTPMTARSQKNTVDRREVMIGASVAAIAALTPALPAFAQEGQAQVQSPTMPEALKTAIGDAKPIEGKVTIDLPEVAENGNTVPFSISIEDDGSTNKVKAVHVFATKNPNPNVASFFFTPRSGKAQVSSRMRLGSTQDVLAVAELTDGSFYMGKKTVKVTIGGCGG
jgi:sulfur-oxidizing protein SoxY